MRKLCRPTQAARDVLQLCAESIQDSSLKARLQAVADDVEGAELEYLQHGEAASLFQITQSLGLGGLSVDEMKRVYKGTFAKSKGTRDIYDSIKKLPANDICPMCGQRTVGTLDHYLAQSLHSALAITPANLVASCMDCNKAKLDAQPADATKQTFHPYFDNTDDLRWLFATVVKAEPAALAYAVHPPPAWDDAKQQRLRHHFKTFGLGALYASHSAAELTNIRFGLQRIGARGTPADVKAELESQAATYGAAQANSWQTAMYHALAASDWYCAGGYN